MKYIEGYEGLYKITEDGLIAQLTLQGTKYYKDENLNKYY